MLHGTRSGQPYDPDREFNGTLNYVRNGADGKGWNVTIGPGIYSQHMAPNQWGWHVGSNSSRFIGIEFAQGQLDSIITESQIQTAAWWLLNVAKKQWPNLNLSASGFVNHSDIDAGNTDVELRGVYTVRDRLLEYL